MSQSGFGLLLRNLRESQEQSLRAAGLKAEVDHAYIYRLETGVKESPSKEVLDRLIDAFKPSERDAEMLVYLASHPEVDPALVDYVFQRPDVSFEIFTAAAGARFRGGGRPDPEALIKRIRAIFEE